MNNVIIKRWNERVGPKDTVYHEGDFCWAGTKLAHEILSALNGKIHLLLGNHDKKRLRKGVAERFESVQDYLELKIDKKMIILCHYAFEAWNGSHRGSWHLYGHSHGKLHHRGWKRMDVGVDTHDFYPYHFDEVKAIMASREEYTPTKDRVT